MLPGDVAQRPAEWEMEEPRPQRAYQGEGYAAVRFGGRNDSRENRRKMNTKDTRNTTADRGIYSYLYELQISSLCIAGFRSFSIDTL